MESLPPPARREPLRIGPSPQDWAGNSARRCWDLRPPDRVSAERPGQRSFPPGWSISGCPTRASPISRNCPSGSPGTGWRVVAVPGLVPDDVFFEHLAHRRFVAGRFIRKPEQLDYLQEPDVFHDLFGHVPLLSDPVFADYMQAYGLGGLKALRLNALEKLARLYWYTVEFGLIAEPGGLRLYGAGILSSFGESQFALDDPSPHRIKFDLMRVMRTRYRIDDYQQNYFVIDNFEEASASDPGCRFHPALRAIGKSFRT